MRYGLKGKIIRKCHVAEMELEIRLVKKKGGGIGFRLNIMRREGILGEKNSIYQEMGVGPNIGLYIGRENRRQDQILQSWKETKNM